MRQPVQQPPFGGQQTVKLELSWNAAFKIGWAVWLVAAFMGTVIGIGFWLVAGVLMNRMMQGQLGP